jgi:DNA topoisomerase-3
LQREANARFGFSAKTTLSIAQALYEKHKVLTYPRTDSRALPEDYLGTVTAAMQALDKPYQPFARRSSLANGAPEQAHFQRRQDSDHRDHSDLACAQHLSDAEAKIYDLVISASRGVSGR